MEIVGSIERDDTLCLLIHQNRALVVLQFSNYLTF